MTRAILAAVGVLSALITPLVGAEPIIFDNRGGEFDWYTSCDPKVCDPGTHLDVSQPASQSGAATEYTYALHYEAEVATPHWSWVSLERGWGLPPGLIHIAADDEPTILIDECGFPTEFEFARELGPGDVVGPDLNLMTRAFLWVSNGATFPITYEWIDTPSYIGVSFTREGQTHYGWMLVANENPILFWIDCKPLLWGYESTPETPITIPELSCPGDANGDVMVDIDDFLEVIGQWGTDPGGPPDFDGDGDVGILDFLAVIGNWGPCPLP